MFILLVVGLIVTVLLLSLAWKARTFGHVTTELYMTGTAGGISALLGFILLLFAPYQDIETWPYVIGVVILFSGGCILLVHARSRWFKKFGSQTNTGTAP